MTSTSPARVCFQLQVDPALLDEYIERHTPVWPEMLAEIAAAGRRNYSLFLGEGGRLIGYYETDDDAAAQAYLAASFERLALDGQMCAAFWPVRQFTTDGDEPLLRRLVLALVRLHNGFRHRNNLIEWIPQ